MMDDLLVAISLLLAWVAFMAMNLAAANRERDKLEHDTDKPNHSR